MGKSITISELRRVDLLAIISRDTFVKETSKNWWAGPCPFCGGEDRFVIKYDRATLEYLWLCRVCGNGKYNDALDYVMQRDRVTLPEAARRIAGGEIAEMTPAAIAERERIVAETRDRRVKEIETFLSKYSNEEIWLAYKNLMTDENRAWWRAQGIPDDWQNFWKLGYTPDKIYEFRDEVYHSPAYTIPKFDYNWRPLNIDYRLLEFPDGAGKYRPSAHLPPAAFLSRPDMAEPADEMFILEGSKKAMVFTVSSGQDIDKTHVYGIPSKTSFANISERAESFGRVYIVLDPDAYKESIRLAQAIGSKARIIRLPVKADDAITSYGMKPADWTAAKKWAVSGEGLDPR